VTRLVVIAVLGAITGLLGTAAPVRAQTDVQAGRFDVAAGIRWIGAMDFASVAANETTAGGGVRALFDSSTALERSFGATASFGLRLTRQFRAEVSAAYSPTHLRTRITGDAEDIPDTTVSEPVTQYLVEGGVVAEPSGWRRGRMSPFLTAGIGYLRQLNDGRTLVQTGRAYYVGGGVSYLRATAQQRRLKAIGFRADVRLLMLRDGVAPPDSTHHAPAVSASLVTRF
jgi:hypothetical protein